MRCRLLLSHLLLEYPACRIDCVGAKLLDGVLILTLQRPEQDKPKRIRISAG